MTLTDAVAQELGKLVIANIELTLRVRDLERELAEAREYATKNGDLP